MEVDQTGRGRLGRELLLAWLHLAVIWSLAFAQPLFDVLADSPEFFVARGNTRGDILVFSFALVLLPPTVLVLVEAAFARLPVIRRLLHLAFVAVLVAAFALQVADDVLGAPSGVLLAVAALVGAAIAVAYGRTKFVPKVLTVLGPAPLVFLIAFLLFSPVSDLVLPQDFEDAARANITSKTPVVFVLFDEFDPDMLMDARGRIDATRHPHFAELADGGTWYRNATTVNSSTALAVPAALTGRRSPSDALPTQEDFPNSVFTLLGGRYEFHVEELATQLCPERLCGSRTRGSTKRRLRSLGKDLGVVSLHLLLPEGLRSGLPAVDRTFGDFQKGGRDSGKSASGDNLGPPPSSVIDRASAVQGLLDGIESRGDRPKFNFAHLILPHVPWQYLPNGQQYQPSEPDIPGLRDEVWDADPLFANLGMQRHMLQVGYSDHLVGEVVDRLRRRGLYDRALVVVTADHGVSYRPGKPRRAPTPQTLSDIAAVPLFIKYPGQRRGKIDDTMVRTIDIVPTIADTLGVRLPYEADGEPIRSGHDMSATVAVDSGRNAAVTASFPAFVRAREAGLRRILALFGSDDGGSGLYATGFGRELLGRPIRTLAAAAPSPARVEFANAQVFAPLNPDSAVIPSFLSGRITGGVGPGAPIAVAVNGRVGGISETFSDGSETRFAVMVPPTSFQPGRNRIDVLSIKGTGAATRLTALEVARPAEYRIVDRDGEQVLVGGGAEVPIADGSVQGAIDDLERDGPAIRVGGWAASKRSERPATRVLVFAGGRLLAQAAPDVIRPDIVRNWKTLAVAKSGYAFRVSGAGVDPKDIRVVAVYQGGASALPVYNP